MARTYGDRCGVARALDAVGERWALLVVRELLLGPKRFSDLRAGLPHVSADILAARLRALEESGVLERRTLPPPAASKVYELTARGRELEPVVLALGRWGSVAPFPPAEDATIGVDAFVIALKTLYAGGGSGRFGLVLDGQPFTVSADGTLEAVRGEPRSADGVITGAPAELAAVLWHGRALESTGITLSGARAGDFFELFPLPQP
jgi:DNA-binding HxlR family transcriptional regulator